MARPTKYKKSYAKLMLDFFTRDYTVKNGRKTEAVNYPTFERFALNIGVSRDTIYEWGNKHPEFSDMLNKCKQIQEDIIIVNTLKGNYHASFAQFLLKNRFNYHDKIQTEQSSEVKIVIDESDEQL
jgi:DNA modification methylase